MSATVIGAPVDGLSGKCNAVEFSTIDVAFLMQVLPNFHFTYISYRKAPVSSNMVQPSLNTAAFSNTFVCKTRIINIELGIC